MSFSYTEKKRVRRSFEKISSVMELPNLLATQVQSYDAFLQRYVDSDKRLNAGLEQACSSPAFNLLSESTYLCRKASYD